MFRIAWNVREETKEELIFSKEKRKKKKDLKKYTPFTIMKMKIKGQMADQVAYVYKITSNHKRTNYNT